MDENDVLKSYKEDDLVWEHPTHSEFQEGCYECHSEARLLRAKSIVDLGTSPHQYKVEDMRTNLNPLE